MKQKRRFIHPNFIIGLISYLSLLVGVILFANGSETGKAIIIGAILLGGLHWLVSVFNVSRDGLMKKDQGLWYFWFATVLIIPPLGGMIYYMVNDKRVTM